MDGESSIGKNLFLFCFAGNVLICGKRRVVLCVWLFNRYIGNMRRGESESAEEFAARVQVASAASLSVKTTNHTVADKVGHFEFVTFLFCT